ncbi:aminopeptidase N [Nocardioides dilutus]
MTSPYASLQHTEALARRELLAVTSYDVELDLSGDEATFGSVTTIALESHGGTTFLDLKPVSVRAVRLDGRPLDVDLLERGRFPLDLPQGQHELVVEATMAFRRDGEGLHRSVDPADGLAYVYGMSFMDAAPSIFACFDQPDLKAPYTMHVTAPSDWVVICNAAAVEPVSAGDGISRWDFAPTPPLSTYFVTLVAGPYHVIRDEHDGIPLGLSSRLSLASALDKDAEEILTVTKQSFDELHRLFGIRYPFGDYHQAFVPEFNAGAMENPGCVTFRDPLVFSSRATRALHIARAATIAHEMAHQWFGDIVTPSWWDDLWLNESFAEYLGNRVTADVTEFADVWTDMTYARRQWGLIADQGPSTHPVAGNGAFDASAALQDFDGISYAKGSSILKQLNASLGDQVFFDGVIDHLTRHRFGNATMLDLFESWERAGAGELDDFTTNWLRTAGPDALTLDRAAGVVRRTPPAAHPADRPHTIRAAVGVEGVWTDRTLELDSPETPFGELPENSAVILDAYVESWVASVPDATTVRALVDLLPNVEDDLLRAGIWDNLRSGYHHGALDPADVLDVAVASLPVEDTEDSERRTMRWLLGSVVPLAGVDALSRVHAAAVAKTEATQPGSGQQLAAFRTVVSTAVDSGALELWAGGANLPQGIALDVDLRWRILVRLATLGAVDLDRLDTELASEPTGEAQVSHAKARASLPTLEAKAWAWSCFTGETEVANYELTAAGIGLWRGGQEAVTASYVDRYFADLPETVQVRSGWMLADAAQYFFPTTSLEDETLAKAQALVADGSLDLSLRRRLADQAAELERLLAVRRAFPHE